MTHRTEPLDPPMVLRDVRQTCQHFPAQWEGVDDQGRDVIVSAEFGGINVTVCLPDGLEQSWDWDVVALDGDPGPSWDEVAKVTGVRRG